MKARIRVWIAIPNRCQPKLMWAKIDASSNQSGGPTKTISGVISGWLWNILTLVCHIPLWLLDNLCFGPLQTTGHTTEDIGDPLRAMAFFKGNFVVHSGLWNFSKCILWSNLGYGTYQMGLSGAHQAMGLNTGYRWSTSWFGGDEIHFKGPMFHMMCPRKLLNVRGVNEIFLSVAFHSLLQFNQSCIKENHWEIQLSRTFNSAFKPLHACLLINS